MDDWLIKWTNTLLGLLGISTLAAASRSILSEDRRSLRGFLRGFILAIFVGGVTGALVHDSGFSAPTQGGIVGISAFVADDILLLVINIAAHLRDNPKSAFEWITRIRK